MKRPLSDEDKAFRQLVVEHDGNIGAIALALGVSRTAVSARLHRLKHRSWWVAYKKERKKRRARARARRWRETRARRTAIALGFYPPDP
jgi:hypothetical protein